LEKLEAAYQKFLVRSAKKRTITEVCHLPLDALSQFVINIINHYNGFGW